MALRPRKNKKKRGVRLTLKEGKESSQHNQLVSERRGEGLKSSLLPGKGERKGMKQRGGERKKEKLFDFGGYDPQLGGKKNKPRKRALFY